MDGVQDNHLKSGGKQKNRAGYKQKTVVGIHQEDTRSPAVDTHAAEGKPQLAAEDSHNYVGSVALYPFLLTFSPMPLKVTR